MPRKSVLIPQVVAASQSMAASFTSQPTMVTYQDNCAYQINITTSDSTGTFSVQGSLDFQQASGTEQAIAGNWIDLELDGVPTAAGANDNILINLNQIPFRALRVAYTPTVAGTGTCDVIVMSKEI